MVGPSTTGVGASLQLAAKEGLHQLLWGKLRNPHPHLDAGLCHALASSLPNPPSQQAGDSLRGQPGGPRTRPPVRGPARPGTKHHSGAKIHLDEPGLRRGAIVG